MTRRFPFDPLVPLIETRYDPGREPSHVTIIGKTAAVLGVHQNVVRRWRHGLSETHADRAAVALDMHPALIWPDWFDEPVWRRLRADALAASWALRHAMWAQMEHAS